MNQLDAADRLQTLAAWVGRLRPDRHNPEQFHESKSEIEKELRRIARRLEREGRAA